MKKWVWITVPALIVGLGLIFLGGAVFAQEPGNPPAPSVNWTAMYDYCRGIMTGNTTATDNDFDGMSGYCQNSTATGNFSAGGMMGNGGMMGSGGMMGNRSFGPGMMGW